jgi:hypothetical protein
MSPMRDLQEQTADEGRADADASNEIARALGSVWQRFSGQRPRSTTVEMGEDVVKFVIEEGGPDAGSDQDGEAPDDPALSPAGLKQNATAAITRITGRRVVAFIDKRDKNAETSTQTFLLDRPQRRF